MKTKTRAVMWSKRWVLFVAAALIALGVAKATAQAPVRKSAPDTSNPCIGVEDAQGLASCGLEAIRLEKYGVAQTAWSKAAEKGDHLAAIWLAGLYANGDLGEKDYLQAYKWYDIAAYMHGAEIERLPPGSHEDNQQEINYRDYAGRKLTSDQIAEVQKQVREWLARRKR